MSVVVDASAIVDLGTATLALGSVDVIEGCPIE